MAEPRSDTVTDKDKKMAARNIVKIDEEKCNGCGQCADACAEAAIKIIDGKARLVSEAYCDGLGACIGHCPQDAITIEIRQAAPFDEEATKKHFTELQRAKHRATSDSKAAPTICPGMAAQMLETKPVADDLSFSVHSQLSHWPVQLKLVSPDAPCFANADLLLVADCVPFAMADFHNRFLTGCSVVIGCPKLDNVDFYIEKLAAILKANSLKSLTVIHMVVPCCYGLTRIAREAAKLSGTNVTFQDVTVDLYGGVVGTEVVKST